MKFRVCQISKYLLCLLKHSLSIWIMNRLKLDVIFYRLPGNQGFDSIDSPSALFFTFQFYKFDTIISERWDNLVKRFRIMPCINLFLE